MVQLVALKAAIFLCYSLEYYYISARCKTFSGSLIATFDRIGRRSFHGDNPPVMDFSLHCVPVTGNHNSTENEVLLSSNQGDKTASSL